MKKLSVVAIWRVISSRWKVLLLLLGTAAFAQDMRHVTEPALRPVSVTLQANLRSDGGKLTPEDETKLDTTRIQDAIDRCAPGKAVRLSANGDRNAFLSGPLILKPGTALQIDKEVILFASRNPRDYDLTPGVCGILTEHGHGCKPLIGGNGADHAAVLGEGIIDGRGGEAILGQHLTWWDLAEKARNTPLNQNCPRIIQVSHCNDFTLYKITLRNSPNFHVFYSQGDGFTVWGVTVFSPKNARNTDGIDPSGSRNVTITHCSIHTGDDQVAIKAGETGRAEHMTIADNHFYTGHGMSIGSETFGGVNAIRVSDLAIEGADNGLRIKSNSSRGGVVEDVVYDNVRIRDTKNPIFMDSNYSFYGKERSKLPVFRAVKLHNVVVQGGGKITLDGFDAAHRLEMSFDGVTFVGQPYEISAQHAILTFGPGPVNFQVSGPDVSVKKISAQ